MDDWAMGETDWARAVVSELGLRGYAVGSFASHMARAALAADSGNLSRIGQGFPHLVNVINAWRAVGNAYLSALAAGDEDALVAAWEAWAEREDRSPATGERYVMDHLTYVSRHGVA
jgi:hypothetical protein